MKNKYEVYRHDYDCEQEKPVVTQREIIADQVVNNEGYLTFFNMDTAVTPPKAILVEIVTPAEWFRIVNMGPVIE
jgi:hypothetical protein